MTYEKDITITLGQPPSLNKFYAGKHWTYRKRLGDDYKKLVKAALAEFDKFTICDFSLSIRYNSRYDCDNSILCSKFVADALVEEGFVADDSPKYYKSLRISYDQTLPKGTYVVKVKYND